MTKLLQNEVDFLNKSEKNPVYSCASRPKKHGGKTYYLSDDSPLISVIAKMRGYSDIISEVRDSFSNVYTKRIVENGKTLYVYTAEQQCIDENKYN